MAFCHLRSNSLSSTRNCRTATVAAAVLIDYQVRMDSIRDALDGNQELARLAARSGGRRSSCWRWQAAIAYSLHKWVRRLLRHALAERVSLLLSVFTPDARRDAAGRSSWRALRHSGCPARSRIRAMAGAAVLIGVIGLIGWTGDHRAEYRRRSLFAAIPPRR